MEHATEREPGRPGPQPDSAETPATPSPGPDWWRDAVVYQVYPRSFADSDGDGLGDLRGVIDHLAYIVALGVDAVWLSPFYPTAEVDAGYDVSDYRAVDPRLGTLADADELIARAHDLGLQVIVDIVPNHTSCQHPWFVAALAAAPGSPERDRFLFATGRGDGPPNDWESNFGGSSWERVGDTDQWYLHTFAVGQPDLNWRNPEVRAEFESILRFWLDRGVDGFRVDVAHGLIKAEGLPDRGHGFVHAVEAGGDEGPMWDQDEVHQIYREWRAVLDTYSPPRILVAEAWTKPHRLSRYLRPDEMHQAFNFPYLAAGWAAERFVPAIRTQATMAAQVGATPTWVLSNHDQPRVVSRVAVADPSAWAGEAIGPDDPQPDVALGTARARALALLTLALPGSAYVYQGEELGLPEHTTLPGSARRDPTYARTGGAVIGRDGSRVPIPWRHDLPRYGWGSPGHEPWLPFPDTFAGLAADLQVGDPASMLALYTRLLALRRRLGLGRAELLDVRAQGSVLHVTTSAVRVVVAMGTDPVAAPGQVLATSAPGVLVDGLLAPDAAVWLAP